MTKSVLVVEDEPLIAWQIEEALKLGGYDVLSFATADAAVVRLNDLHYWCDVVVTDVHMPGKLDGWSLARNARERFPDVAVIYLTGDSMLSWSAEKVDNGLIFQKPVSICSIVATVRRLSSHRQSADTRLPAPLPNDAQDMTAERRTPLRDYS